MNAACDAPNYRSSQSLAESSPRFVETDMHWTLIALTLLMAQDDFSGPQPGEPLPDCKLQVVLGPHRGSEIQLLEQVGDEPSMVIFVHEVTRPAIGLVRTVTRYAQKRAKDGFVVHLVFLTADPTETETWMNRARVALPSGINISISPEGIEGPGEFGLNRKMQVTVIIAKNKKVTANFAIIQPSIKADAQKIGSAIAKTLGDPTMPTEQELGIQSGGRPMRASEQDKQDKQDKEEQDKQDVEKTEEVPSPSAPQRSETM